MDDDKFYDCIRWATDPHMFAPNLVVRGTKAQKTIVRNQERAWGNLMRTYLVKTGQETNQWTTVVGEYLVREVLERLGKHPVRPVVKNGYQPDWETEDAIWEVKTRTWSTPGSAGEKILGTAYKYAPAVRLFNKPLRIVCIGYQEYEADKWSLFSPVHTEHLMIRQMWRALKIDYMRFSDLIAPLLYDSNNMTTL